MKMTHTNTQVLDQEDILQHFEREMGAKDTQIQSLLSDIKVQHTRATDAVAHSEIEISRQKLECERLVMEKEARLLALEEELQSTETLREVGHA